MNELRLINQNGQIVTSSRQIAENFNKEHKNVIRDIETILEGMLKIEPTPMFSKTTYIHEQNKQEYPEYLMNRDGFTLLAMGFTGTEAMQWKIKYIQAFNEMEKQLTVLPQMTQTQIVAAIANSQVEQEKQLKQIASDVQGIRDIVALNHHSWRDDTKTLINKMATQQGGPEHIQDLRRESYDLLNTRMGVSVESRLTNKRRRMADEGVCKSKRDKLNPLDVIGEDKKLIEGYVAIIKEMAIKYSA